MRRIATQSEYVLQKLIFGVLMISENLQNLRKKLLLKQDEFALKLDIAPRAYANYERGERKPPYEMLIKLTDDFNVNLNWLIAGKGEMFIQPEKNFAAEYEDVKEDILKKVQEMLKEKGL